MIREKDLISEIAFYEDNLQRARAELEKLSAEMPGGARLRVAARGKNYQYFMRMLGDRSSGEYIHKKDMKKAVSLAQIEYDEKLIMLLEKAVDALKDCREAVMDDIFGAALGRMTPGKRELIDQPYVSDELYVKSWKEQEYDGLAFRDEISAFYSRRGLRVRSKSEVIIADILDEMGIPFLYEKPLRLKRETVYPDFTILNVIERREIYWEHFGMMDDKEYRDSALMKIRKYEENGLYQYDSVIWTFETGRIPVNTRDIRKMVSILKKRLT